MRQDCLRSWIASCESIQFRIAAQEVSNPADARALFPRELQGEDHDHNEELARADE